MDKFYDLCGLKNSGHITYIFKRFLFQLDRFLRVV
ncbi:hypothetical protein E2C01_027136 [Portunus trituberculatus]|uniref:Uncharacterized protein n=1 Tax=Portunus trituberculatus TaxID=210409 RepID=A0A5B7EK28_PORTR|nr:hypothetical protein [Portunus trituberculatus]